MKTDGKSFTDARNTVSEVDREIAALFEKRMKAVRVIAQYKSENGLPVFDGAREAELLGRNAGYISDPEILPYYKKFAADAVEISKKYQRKLIGDTEKDGRMTLHVDTSGAGYDITVGRGCVDCTGDMLRGYKKVLVVTDSGVPAQYAQRVAAACEGAVIVTVEQGEQTKNPDTYVMLLKRMLAERFTRRDCVVAVGGGVVGDLSGFAAASYMRGIDFYNIPTTLLSQLDSSIGGKTAVDLDGIKNSIGAFHAPRRVLIDPDLLATLPRRHVSNGLAEAIKMSLTSDPVLFEIFESGDISARLEEIIIRSLRVKRYVVQEDEKEQGLRRILNFGHTLGHGIESAEGCSGLLHGECVALGMIPMCSNSVRSRLIPVLEDAGLPTAYDGNADSVIEAVMHDKKAGADGITAVTVEAPGSFEFVRMDRTALSERLALIPHGRE